MRDLWIVVVAADEQWRDICYGCYLVWLCSSWVGKLAVEMDTTSSCVTVTNYGFSTVSLAKYKLKSSTSEQVRVVGKLILDASARSGVGDLATVTVDGVVTGVRVPRRQLGQQRSRVSVVWQGEARCLL